MREPNVRGTIAYAFKDPNGRSTQAFINLSDNRTTHDKEFVPFAASRRHGRRRFPLRWVRRGALAASAAAKDPVFDGGNAYLLRTYPRLDYIVRAAIRY